MADYAIGDIHACLSAFNALLERLEFNPSQDRLWLTGDLIGRGPEALATLRQLYQMGDCVQSVLGNHDLHCLAVAGGHTAERLDDALGELLSAPDAGALLDWLRQRPLCVDIPNTPYTLMHAGLSPQWTLAQAHDYAREAETALRGPDAEALMAHLYGNQPARWQPDLRGWDRLRYIINAFTRMRFCHTDGRLDFTQNGPPETAPPGLHPWYAVPGHALGIADRTLITGHWSRLGYRQGRGFVCLDSGCLWGGQLTALRLDQSSGVITQVQCADD